MAKLWVEGSSRVGLEEGLLWLGLLAGAIGLGGCAVGAEGTSQSLGSDPALDGRNPVMSAGSGASGVGGTGGASTVVGGAGGASGASGITNLAGTGGVTGMSGMAGAVSMGEACERGSTAPCTCSDGASTGEKSCQFDASSPTMGSFGACKKCPAPSAGSGGAGGASGAGGTGGAGGAGGAGGTSGAGGGAGSGGSVMCGTMACPAAAPPEMACCNLLGECGMTLLGICL